MSAPSDTVYISATSPVAIPAASSPPIVEFARLSGHVLALFFSYLARASSTLWRYLLAPLPLFSTPVLYLLAPVIVLLQVLLEVLVISPYSIAVSLARNIYPIYVFVGAACICAVLFGMLARTVTSGLVYAIFAPRSASDRPEEAYPDKRTLSRPPRRRKRVSIKEER